MSSLRLLVAALLLCLFVPQTALAQTTEAPSLHQQLQAFDRELDIYLGRFERGGCDDAAQVLERARVRLEFLESELHRLPPASAEPLRGKLAMLENRMGDLHKVVESGGEVLPPRGPSPTRGPSRGGTPANDDCADAIVIGIGTVAGDTSNATNDGETTCGSSLFSPDVWYKLVFPDSVTLYLDTFGSTYDTVLSVHEACPGTVANTLVCDDDTSGLDSAVGLFASVGSERLVRVSGFAGQTGAFTLNVGLAGGISGKVTAAATGDPLEDLRVDLWDGDGFGVGSTVTGPAGEYSIEGLAPGVYFAATRNSAGYLDELYDDLPCPGGGSFGGGCDPTTGTPILVEVDTVTESIDFDLDLGGAIEGQVIDASAGTGAEGVRVELWDAAGQAVDTELTGAAGDYAFIGLEAGDYFVNTDTSDFGDELYDDLPCPGGAPYGCDPTTGTPVAVAVAATTAGIDFVLDRLGNVTGTVTEAGTGTPLSSIYVEIWSDVGVRVGDDYTDAAGVYSVGGLTTGTFFAVAEGSLHVDELYDGFPCPGGAPYGCDPTTGTSIAVTVNDTTAGIDFVLDRLGSVAGVVTDAATGDPVPFAGIEVWDAGGFAAYADTDFTGVYTVDELDAGTYFVVTDAHAYLDEVFDDLPCPGGVTCDPRSGTPVAVELNATTPDVDFALVRMGAIAGTVTDQVTGAPISSATVRIWNAAGQNVRSTSVNGAGEYQAGSLEAGTYYATTDAFDDYLDELYQELPCPPSACDPTAGAAIEVADGATTGGVDFTLILGAAISGTVTAADGGGAISSGEVYVYDALGNRIADPNLDGSGQYRIGGLEAGTYYARTRLFFSTTYVEELFDDLSCPNGGCDPLTGTPIVVALGDDAGVDFALDRWGEISGQITDAVSSEPISYGRVRVYDASGTFIATDSADLTGFYTVDRLAAGSYYVRTYNVSGYLDELYEELPCPAECDPTTGTPVEVSLNADTQDIDFTLDREGAVSGFVTSAATGAPLAGIRVEIWNPSGNYVTGSSTDASGLYTVDDLSPGVYFARTDTSGWDDEIFDDLPCAGFCDPTVGTPIEVAINATTRHIDFALERSASISGTVTHALTGQPLANVRVRVVRATGSSAGSDYTDAAGSYRVDDLPAGTYFAITDGDGYLNEIYDGVPCPGGCNLALGTPIEVVANSDLTGIDFQLDRLGSLSGTVIDAATSGPISGVRVEAWTEAGSYAGTGFTGGLGEYLVDELLPGNYFLVFDPDNHAGELYDDLPCHDGNCDVTTGTPVAVALNATTGGVDAALDLLGAISGIVTDSLTGGPIDGVRVEIWDAESDYVTSTTTDSSGNYEVPQLGPGTYYVTTENYQDYLDELYDDLPCLAGAPSGCDPDKGTAVVVAIGTTTEGIDFGLIRASTGISGVVTEAASGAPLAGAILDVWDDAGVHVTSVVSAPSGAYYASLPPAVYHVSSDHGSPDLTEEVYDGMLCPLGPAFAGHCDPTDGAPVTVEESGSVGVPGVTMNVDFTLEPTLLFSDGFESGDVSAWSAVVGGG